jgi:O-antigen/teichoic acid export membrane protein
MATTPTTHATQGAPEREPELLERALRRAGSDAFRYLPVRLVAALTSLVTVPVFTAAIDKEDYGAFYLVISAATLLSGVATGWLGSSTVRFYWPAKREGRLDAYVSTILWSSVASLLLTGFAAATLAYVSRSGMAAALWRLVPAGLAYFFFNTLTNVLVQVLRSAGKARSYARLQIAGIVLTTVFSVVLVWWARLGALGILLGVAAGWAAVLPFMLQDVGAEGALAPGAADSPTLRQYMAYGLPLVPAGVAGWSLALLDRFIIDWARGPGEVGLYSVAWSLGDRIMQLVTVPLVLTMLPSLTEAFERSGQRLAERVQTQFIRYLALVTIPVLAGLAVSGRLFMKAFTAPVYTEAWPVLAVVATGSALSSLSQIATAGLGLKKRTRLMMMDAIAAACFNLVANALLVPLFGYVAAAWTSVASISLLVGLAWWQSREHMSSPGQRSRASPSPVWGWRSW